MAINRLLAVFICCVALLTLGICEDSTDGVLTGVVTDPDGAVVPDATIRIQHWTYDKFGQTPREKCDAEIYADRAGRFAVRLHPGGYEVFVGFPGLAAVVKSVRIRSGKTTKFNQRLRFDPSAKPFS